MRSTTTTNLFPSFPSFLSLFLPFLLLLLLPLNNFHIFDYLLCIFDYLVSSHLLLLLLLDIRECECFDIVDNPLLVESSSTFLTICSAFLTLLSSSPLLSSPLLLPSTNT
ncbi:hypothetical protein BDR03DRAFT_1010733 [Suillus americanus]|nr:hypothetical protein BDR03DRAFT_1010733 [Suillus americanus]